MRARDYRTRVLVVPMTTADRLIYDCRNELLASVARAMAEAVCRRISTYTAFQERGRHLIDTREDIWADL